MADGRIQLAEPPLPAPSLTAGIEAIRAELALPAAFPPAAESEAAAGTPAGHADAATWLVAGGARSDRTALPLVTLDPPGSRDLDQAFAIESAEGGGHTLHYAIADVAAHVRPGSQVDRESQLRGETIYLPGSRIPLHPPVLSEGAASLLPGVDRLAVVWTLAIDADGTLTGTTVERATVQSTAQLDYPAAAAALAAGDAHPQLRQLAVLGPRLVAAARRRGAIELPEPAQELVAEAAGGWRLAWLPREDVEDWNAELSLATGRAAAALMLSGRTGLLRTLPPAPADAAPRLRTAAHALGIDWPAGEPLAERLARLEPAEPAHLALIDQARALLRGAGYLPLAGVLPTDDDAVHAAVAAPYAHVTAPLRRLGDRYATEAALAAARGVAAPDWVVAALPGLPELLTASGRRAGAADRSVVDLAEATALEHRVGEQFEAAIIEVEKGVADIRIEAPPIRARADGPGLVAGTRAMVQLTVADPARRRVRFAAVGPDAAGPASATESQRNLN